MNYGKKATTHLPVLEKNNYFIQFFFTIMYVITKKTIFNIFHGRLPVFLLQMLISGQPVKLAMSSES